LLLSFDRYFILFIYLFHYLSWRYTILLDCENYKGSRAWKLKNNRKQIRTFPLSSEVEHSAIHNKSRHRRTKYKTELPLLPLQRLSLLFLSRDPIKITTHSATKSIEIRLITLHRLLFMMGSMSHVITFHGLADSNRYCHGGFSHSNHLFMKTAVPTRSASVFPKVKSQSSDTKSAAVIDFSDPDWKTKFKNDFEERFRLPHVTDIFPDAASMPSTFSPNVRLVSLCFLRTFFIQTRYYFYQSQSFT